MKGKQLPTCIAGVRTAALCGIAGLLAFPSAAAPKGSNMLVGEWDLIRNPYRSKIAIVISDVSFDARVGCMSLGGRYEAAGGELKPINWIVHEAPCFPREADKAGPYWIAVHNTLSAVTRYEQRRGVLILRTPEGAELRFKRVRRAH